MPLGRAPWALEIKRDKMFVIQSGGGLMSPPLPLQPSSLSMWPTKIRGKRRAIFADKTSALTATPPREFRKSLKAREDATI